MDERQQQALTKGHYSNDCPVTYCAVWTTVGCASGCPCPDPDNLNLGGFSLYDTEGSENSYKQGDMEFKLSFMAATDVRRSDF